MARQKLKTTIIWQSERFPWMTFTDLQLEVFRERYPRVQKWLPLLKELETWVATNAATAPERIPSPKGWGNFLNNCARRRNRDIEMGIRRPDGTRVTATGQTNSEYYQKSEVRGQRSMSSAVIADKATTLREKLAAERDPVKRKQLQTQLQSIQADALPLTDIFKKLAGTQ